MFGGSHYGSARGESQMRHHRWLGVAANPRKNMATPGVAMVVGT